MNHARWPAALSLAALTALGGPLSAGDLYPAKEPAKLPTAALPRPAEVKALEVRPAKVDLKGSDDSYQLILTAALDGGTLRDLTRDASYEVADPKVARVSAGGRIVPVANG